MSELHNAARLHDVRTERGELERKRYKLNSEILAIESQLSRLSAEERRLRDGGDQPA